METSADRVGGKAAVLFELERAGFRVPRTYCSPPDLAAVVDELGPPIAVRSSATCEDGSETSFAGQFESFMPLSTLAEVEEAVEKCRASIQAESVVEYCKKNGIDHGAIRMEVIVQQMIDPELAGVAFTVNPVTGQDEVVIEAVEGLAEDLLSGKAASLPRDHPLVEKYAPAVEEAARKVQLHFGTPQDVEFAIQGGELFLVQARPITRIGFSAEVGEWTNADFRDGGVSSTVCTPLMWSLYDTIWEDSLKAFFRQIKLLGADEDFQAGRMFFGRPYWNLGEVKKCLARLPGFNEREFDNDLSVEIRYEGDGLVTPVNLWTILKTIPTALAVPGVFKQQMAFNEGFIAGGYDELAARFEQVPEPAELDAGFRRLIDEGYRTTELNYFRTIYVAHIAKILFDDAFKDVDSPALVSALPEMSHLAPTRAFQRMVAADETDLAPILAEFRHHSRRELDLRVPRWDEDPEHVQELLEAFQRAGPANTTRDPRARYEQARAETRASLGWLKRGGFDKKLDRLRTLLWQREEMRDRSMRMYYLIRRWVLAIAEARGLGDDIFFMTWQEILDDDRRNIATARDVYERFRNFAAPNEIGSRFLGGPVAFDESSDTLNGIGAAQGTARGVARVARTVEEAVRIEEGAILVCPFTDPGWTPVLDRVAGVITESGGLLSHAAVICREYGIPAVLGIAGATKRIPDGQTVVLHGGEGRVELVG